MFRKTRNKYFFYRDLFQDLFDGSSINLHKWTITDTESKLSLNGAGALSCSGGMATPAWGDPKLVSVQSFTRQNGLTLEFELTPVTGATYGVAFADATSDATPLTEIPHGFFFNGSLVLNASVAGGNVATPVTVTTATSYCFRVILKASGALYYYSTDSGATWKALWETTSNTASPLWAWISENTVAFTLKDIKVLQRSLPSSLIDTTPTAPTPALGSELWDAPAAAFTSGTYNWTVYGTNTITNDTNTLKITYVDNSGGAYDYFRNISDLSSDLTVGGWYLFQTDAKVDTGNSVALQVAGGSGDNRTFVTVTSTTFATYKAAFRCREAATGYVQLAGLGTGEITWLDNLSLKPMTLSSLVSLVADASTREGIFDCAPTISEGYQGGIMVALDDESNPLYYIQAHVDRSIGKAYFLKVENGTTTELVGANITYSAGAQLRVVAVGTSWALYYNGAKVGATQTVDTSSGYGTKVAAFQTLTTDSVGTVALKGGLP